ncbi:DUF6207 family protein [Streptomyces niveus]|uniref:DUF6207 family protein n=1 Tax=Streptomyces niveus TaxID=193462 RepID=UPI0035DB65DA
MDRIDATQIPEPGLVVLDLTAHDETTALAVMEVLECLWATSGITPYDGNLGCRGSAPASTRTSGTPAPSPPRRSTARGRRRRSSSHGSSERAFNASSSR